MIVGVNWLESKVKLNAAEFADSVTSNWRATTDLTPSPEIAVVVIDHVPEATVALPIKVSPIYKLTVAPLMPVPVKIGVVIEVMLSELLGPLSLAVARSRMAGAGVIREVFVDQADSK